jgi:glycosyltransferase involved in cell wall biosynthesis
MRGSGRLSILQFTNAEVRAGAEEHILALLRGIDRAGFKLHCVCPPCLAELLAPDMPADVELIPLELGKVSHVAAAVRFARVLLTRRIDVLHSHMFTSSLFASPIGRLCQTPVILETAHGREAWRRGWKASFFIDRVISHAVDGYIAVSTANAIYLRDKKQYDPRKITVIEPGSDFTRFSSEWPADPELRECHGIDPEDPLIVVVGRLEPQKGHAVLLDALPRVLAAFPRTKVALVGEGSCRSAIEAQIENLGLRNVVTLTGYAPDVRDWLAHATLTVLPSFHEGLPVTPIESLAAGKAVVATAVDGTTDVVIDGRTGLTAPPGDPASLAESICRLLGDAALRERLARDGRDWVLANFSVSRMIRRTEDLYRAMFDRHSAAGIGTPFQSIPEPMAACEVSHARKA